METVKLLETKVASSTNGHDEFGNKEDGHEVDRGGKEDRVDIQSLRGILGAWVVKSHNDGLDRVVESETDCGEGNDQGETNNGTREPLCVWTMEDSLDLEHHGNFNTNHGEAVKQSGTSIDVQVILTHELMHESCELCRRSSVTTKEITVVETRVNDSHEKTELVEEEDRCLSVLGNNPQDNHCDTTSS